MPPVGYLLWHFPDTAEFGESLPTGQVVPLPVETLVLRAAYLTEADLAGNALANARQRLTPENAHLLRVVSSTDGPPARSALVYVRSGGDEVDRVGDWLGLYRAQAVRYQAVRMGSSYAWESDASLGRPGYFVTGTSGPSALWRIVRVEADALERQVVTLFPARLPHPLAAPDFEKVAEPLRGFLRQHFESFAKAVAANLYLDVVDRANSLAEGILDHCLTSAGRTVPKTLYERVEEVRKVMADPNRPATFPLTGYGIALADRIRLLHQRTHANRAAQGQALRPEVGMSAAIDLSELMIEAGLGRY
jgi:hypothetical protein